MSVKPPLKWAGSKTRVMPELLKHLPAGTGGNCNAPEIIAVGMPAAKAEGVVL